MLGRQYVFDKDIQEFKVLYVNLINQALDSPVFPGEYFIFESTFI